MPAEDLPKNYQPGEIEGRWYRHWKEAGYFHADAAAPYAPFSMIFPPPNITGILHMGHALTCTIQDVLVRWRRMQGYNTLWLPGTDHAGIATQMVVERELRESEGKSRHDLGREKFLERVWAWKEKHGSRIATQLELLGASMDWQRACFTMDAERSHAVREAFVRLHEEGLVYRAERLINWCTRCRTALSDLEVEAEPSMGELFHFAYTLDGGGEIVVATTRPETMLGDTAVAVHPDDERYKALIGRTIAHPFVERALRIIGDPVLVDPTFGTGAVKVTPAHDWNDFEAGKRNGLPMVNILNLDGTLNAETGAFAGIDRREARKRVVEELTARGLARGTTPHAIPVPRCQRCRAIVEPMISLQWFVSAEPLAKPAILAVEQGQTTFVPEGWTGTYFQWMRNIKDWCVSRQLWWGHRIPAWYCDAGHVTVARTDPPSCSTCGDARLRQDDDVLDTWFSSALWPLSTLGWPGATPALRSFYPTSVMETGYDILFFWVARMMMMGIHFMEKVPFRTVLLHSMIVDERGEKMSKVKGNVIDPADVIEKHGADALRFALVWLSTPAAQGRPVKLSMRRIEESRHFCTKIWNAARLALMNLEGHDADTFAIALQDGPEGASLSLADRWILSRLHRTAAEVGGALEAFKLNEAAQILHRFFWHELCDWYLEMVKGPLRGEGAPHDPSDRRTLIAAQGTLATVLDVALRLLHPFMPFVTEEIWRTLPRPDGVPQSLMITLYPTADERFLDDEAERTVALLQTVISELREIRALYNVPGQTRLEATLVTTDTRTRAAIEAHGAIVRDLARLDRLSVAAEPPPRDGSTAVGVFGEIELFVRPVDIAGERLRLQKKLDRAMADLASCQRKLDDEAFRARAPDEVLKEWEERARSLGEEVKRLRDATEGGAE